METIEISAQNTRARGPSERHWLTGGRAKAKSESAATGES